MGGFNPEVALGVNTNLLQPQGQMNPLEMMRTVTDVARTQQQMQLTNNQIAARNGMSDLIASTPPDQIGARLMASPYWVWAPEVSETYAHIGQINAATGEIQQRIGDTALEQYSKALYQLGGADPSQYGDILKNARASVLATTPQDRIPFVTKGMDAADASLASGGGMTDPAVMRRNLLGQTARWGVTPDQIGMDWGGQYHEINGFPFWTSFQDPGLMFPLRPNGNADLNSPLGIASGTGAPIGAPTMVGGPAGAPPPPSVALPPAGGPPGMTPPGPTAGGPQGPMPGPGGMAPPSVHASGPGVSAPVMGPGGVPYAMSDGKPLYSGSLAGRAQTPPTNINPVTRQAVYDPAIQKRIDDANEQAGGIDASRFEDAQRTLNQTTLIRQSVANLSASGGLMTPGSHLDQRAGLVDGYNTIRAMLGDKSNTAELNNSADFNEISKQLANLQASSAAQNFPGSRETVAFLNNAIKGNPGLNNTALSLQLLNRGIEAAAQRQIDEFRYVQAWGAVNHGNIIDAKAAFAAEHPISDMGNKILSEYGLGPHGWGGATGAETTQNITNAYNQHLLTWDQANDALNHRPMREMQ